MGKVNYINPILSLSLTHLMLFPRDAQRLFILLLWSVLYYDHLGTGLFLQLFDGLTALTCSKGGGGETRIGLGM